MFVAAALAATTAVVPTRAKSTSGALARLLQCPPGMSTSLLASHLRVAVACSSDEIAADVRDRRPEQIAFFAGLSEAQREQLALDAWTIGLRALYNAHTAAQESKLEDVGANLLAAVAQHLSAHVEQQQTTITSVLARFFDPTDGQVTQRLAAFVDDHGVLARLLEKYLGPQNSILAEALSRQIGETSPILRALSPTDSNGVVKLLEAQLRLVMGESQTQLARALDPSVEDGAVARFLRSLREQLNGANEDQQKQLAAALAALDANDEGSLLSRLVRETQRAQQEVLAAVNPDAPNSPLAILKASLTQLLHDHGASQMELARRQEERQMTFEKDIREALTRIETKRAQDQKGTRGGLEYEDAVTSFVRAATQGAPCVFDVTGASAGVGRCKKGDAILRFTAESAFAGVGVVFEAKRDASYGVQMALDELDAARKNRDASVGVFVMARSHAGEGFPRFARYGNNVLVVWDEQDPSTDFHLHAAILLGMGLATRIRTTGDEGDISALRDIESRIEGELARLEKMEKCSGSIRKNVDDIGDEIRKANKALDLLLRKAQSTLKALKIEVSDETAEKTTPIALPKDSLQAAVLALPDGDEAA